jgi:type II secretory ATPase GspE/PulE/Tfp pilus assembly ATPase PilB-like protein
MTTWTGFDMSIGTVLGDAFFLVSFWKPIILLLPLVGWAWVISAHYDKHAARFFLPRQMWNVIHLSVGFVALVAALLAVPMQGEGAFWIGLAVMIVLLTADLYAYAWFANRDERVPEEFHIRFNQLFARIAEARAEKAAAKKQGKVELVIKGPDKAVLAAPSNESPEFAVRVGSEALAVKAFELRASQLDLAPGAKDGAYVVAYLVDGVRQAGSPLPPADAVKIIDFWKSAAKLDVTDRRRRQSADVNVERGVDRHKLRVVASGAQGGMRMTVLVDPEKQVKRKAADLGLLEAQMAEMKAIVEERKGVVLLAAPPDMGRTTTLYSVLKMHDAYTSNVQTVEMEPQDSLEGVRQNVFEAQGEGPEYSTLVRSILRRDPQVVGVADLPDEATAKEVARAEVDRCRVYLSVKADNALAAVQAWVKAVGDPAAAGKVLYGVTAQRLVRKLCVNCRQAYQPSPDMLKKLGLPADKVKQLFKKGGQVLIKNKPEVCPVCSGIGYIGQEGLFEVYRIGSPERELVKAGNLNGLRAELRKKSLPTIQQVALRKAVEGITSIEEVLRVTADGAGPAGGERKPSATPVGST